jgi:hypothetical protein
VRVAVAVVGGCPIRSLERTPRDGRVVSMMLRTVRLGKTDCSEIVAKWPLSERNDCYHGAGQTKSREDAIAALILGFRWILLPGRDSRFHCGSVNYQFGLVRPRIGSHASRKWVRGNIDKQGRK